MADREDARLCVGIRTASVDCAVLHFIERSIGRGFRGYSSAANAADLELLAAGLTAARWGGEVWARGHATDAELGKVLPELSQAAIREEQQAGGNR